MHGYALYYRNIDRAKGPLSGIDNKVAMQIEALNRAGLNCEFKFCQQPESLSGMAKSCLPFFPDGISWPDPDELADADYLYIRQPRFISREGIEFLRSVKHNKPETYIIYELPNYPYDGQMKEIRQRGALAKDRRWRGHLKEAVDAIAALIHIPEIFGVPTVFIRNGVDLDQIPGRTPYSSDGTLHLLLAAYFAQVHGVDLVLEGLNEYYQSADSPRDIHVHLCGDSYLVPRLKRLTKRLSLEGVVEFHGALSPSELAPLYNVCSLGLESFATHRRDASNTMSASLKSREYLAKGLPFVCANDIDFLLEEPAEFVLQLPGGEHPVDIQAIIDFHDRLYSNHSAEMLVLEMRRYAERHISMDRAMENVVSAIKGHCS